VGKPLFRTNMIKLHIMVLGIRGYTRKQ
jgi:hypothetical protein